MKAPGSWAALLLCLSYAHSLAVAQKTPALRTVPVVVADAHTVTAQPVPTVRVSLGFLDGSVQVTESRDVTNPKGQASLRRCRRMRPNAGACALRSPAPAIW